MARTAGVGSWKLKAVGSWKWLKWCVEVEVTSWTDEMHNICTYYFPSVWLRISSSFQVSGENWRDE